MVSSIRKKIKLLVLLELCFLASLLSLISQTFQNNDTNLLRNETNKFEDSIKSLPETSVAPPIFIDDRDPNYNWSKTASENEWVSGSGTVGDPYVISNLTINGFGGNCIEIKDSEFSNFIIKDTILFNGSSGIYLDNTRNGNLENNLIFNTSVAGINLYSCGWSYNAVINNTVINNGGHGILVRASLYNEIISNNIHNNDGNGIYISSFSDYNNVENNTVTYNQHGIRLYQGSRFTLIFNNTIEHNTQHGIYVYQDCEYTDIINNRINFNGQNGINMRVRSYGFIQYNLLDSNMNYGMYISNSGYFRNDHISFNTIINSTAGISIRYIDYVKVLDNDIYDIDGIGIHVYNSDHNLISNNHLVGYSQAIVEEYSSANTITNNLCGEDLYEENDNFNNAKAIYKGWTRYLAANDEDWFFTYLNEGDTLYLELQFLNSSGNLNLGLYNDQGILLKSSTSETDNELIIQNISIGAFYFFRVYNDVNGLYSLNIESKDSFAPSIKIVAPILNELFRSIPPQFIVEVHDLNLETMWYSINDSQSVIFTSNGSISQSLWNALQDGILILKFFANDSAGNFNMKSVIIEKSAIPPSLVISTPLNNNIYNQTPPEFNVLIFDTTLLDMWYVVSNETYYSEKTFFIDNGTIDANIWDYFSDGQLNITFYANDTAGNRNSSSILVYKDTLPPDLTINSPFQFQLFGSDGPNFDLILYDANPVSLWYTLNDNTTLHYSSNSSGIIDKAGWDACSNGTVLIKFYFQDITGEIVSKEVIVRKDIEPPIIYFAFAPPYVNNTHPQYYQDWVDVFCKINDRSGIDDVIFEMRYQSGWGYTLFEYLYNFYDDTWEHSIDISYFDWNDSLSFRFIASDVAGNVVYTPYYNFTIRDDINPQTTITYSDVVIPSTLFSLNASDLQGSGISMIKYKINDSAWFDYVEPFGLDGFDFGTYEISYYSIDNAGNIENIKHLYITLIDPNSQETPAGIPSFLPLPIILMIGGYVFLSIYKFKKKEL